MPMPDDYCTVNNPSHYQSRTGIECIDAIEACMSEEEFRGFCKGNVLKYVWREAAKGGDESLAKANWYLSRILGEPLTIHGELDIVEQRRLLGTLLMYDAVHDVYVDDLVVRRSGGSSDHLVGEMSQVIGFCDGLLVMAPVSDWKPLVNSVFADAPAYYELLIN